MLTARTGWRTSTYSSNGADCVEVEPVHPCGVTIRHSKHPAGPTIGFSPSQWASWLVELTSGEISNTNGAVRMSVGFGGWVLESIQTGAVLRFTQSEAAAFVRGVRDGEFDLGPQPDPAEAISSTG